MHMIIVSVNRKKQLFGVLNTKISVFNFGAIFYNLCKMPMKPRDDLTEHFIMFMKYYLQEIENSVLKVTQSVHSKSLHAEKMKEARSISSLTV